jgi:hypothetical protein
MTWEDDDHRDEGSAERDDADALTDRCECGQIKGALYDTCDDCDNQRGEAA